MTMDPLLRNLIVGVIMHIITKQKKLKLFTSNTHNGSYLWVSLWETQRHILKQSDICETQRHSFAWLTVTLKIVWKTQQHLGNTTAF
jgi:hypothetical protein